MFDRSYLNMLYFKYENFPGKHTQADLHNTMPVIRGSVWGHRARWEGEIELLLGVFNVSRYIFLHKTANSR